MSYEREGTSRCVYNFGVDGCTHVPLNRRFSYTGSVQGTEEAEEDCKDSVAKDVELLSPSANVILMLHLRSLRSSACT